MSVVSEFVGLNSPRGRITVIGLITVLVFLAPYRWLGNLSLLQALGWHSAPSIGLTRAYHLLLHGHFDAAWTRNHLIYPVVLIFGSIIVSDCFKIFSVSSKKTK